MIYNEKNEYKYHHGHDHEHAHDGCEHSQEHVHGGHDHAHEVSEDCGCQSVACDCQSNSNKEEETLKILLDH